MGRQCDLAFGHDGKPMYISGPTMTGEISASCTVTAGQLRDTTSKTTTNFRHKNLRQAWT
jgi:hypothetical protein